MTIAALVAAQIWAVAGPAQATEPLRHEPEAQQSAPERGNLADRGSRDRIGQGLDLALADRQAAESPQEAGAQDQPRKRKSTGDKLLTGAAVILGVGALAVGGLLIAIFVN
jgi:hypothetical protein